jgi:hypothetical protein
LARKINLLELEFTRFVEFAGFVEFSESEFVGICRINKMLGNKIP